MAFKFSLSARSVLVAVQYHPASCSVSAGPSWLAVMFSADARSRNVQPWLMKLATAATLSNARLDQEDQCFLDA